MSKRKALPGTYTAEEAAKRIAIVSKQPEKTEAYYKLVINLGKEKKLPSKMSGKNNRYWNFEKQAVEDFAQNELENKETQITIDDIINSSNHNELDKLNNLKSLIECHEKLKIDPKMTLNVIKHLLNK